MTDLQSRSPSPPDAPAVRKGASDRRSLRVAIDYTAAMWQDAGIGRYTRELVRATLEQGAPHRYSLFYAAGGLPQHGPALAALRQICAAHPNVRAVPIPLSPRRLTQLWQRLRVPLPLELFAGPLDLVHSPDFVLPPTRARTIVTVHDLSFLVHPELTVPSMVRYLSSAVPRSVRRADSVLADSEWTKRDIVRLLGVDEARVATIYPGVTPEFRPLPAEATEPVRARLGLPKQFVLFVSTLSPRKNVERLVEAFALLIQEKRIAPEMALVLVGRRGWMDEPIFEAIRRLELGEQVRWLDYLDDKDLPAVYNLADATAYPSLYEGFGLPALEALACGSPVVTANNSSLPEAVGDAAVLVEAEQVGSIADGIARVLGDAELRARLREAGVSQAREFTWERAAQQLIVCYEQVASLDKRTR